MINISMDAFRKILIAFMIVFTIIFFITLFVNNGFIRVVVPLLSMSGNVFCGFFYGYSIGLIVSKEGKDKK